MPGACVLLSKETWSDLDGNASTTAIMVPCFNCLSPWQALVIPGVPAGPAERIDRRITNRQKRVGCVLINGEGSDSSKSAVVHYRQHNVVQLPLRVSPSFECVTDT